MTLHDKPSRFVQVVENALDLAWKNEPVWERVHDFYTQRYLNQDSPEKANLHLYGWDTRLRRNLAGAQRRVSMKHWYEINCAKCQTPNLVDNGDLDDMTVLDVDGFRCYSCGAGNMITGDGDVIETDESECLDDGYPVPH
jgi:hypothetical protein